MCLNILKQSRYASIDMILQLTPPMYNCGFMLLEDNILETGVRPLNNNCVESPYKENEALCNRHLLRKTCNDAARLLSFVEESDKLLNPEQAIVYIYILTTLEDITGDILFLDAPGGTRKAFILSLLLAKVHQSGQIVIAIASSGLASTLLDGSRTVLSTFKPPINISHAENSTTNINKNSDEVVVFQNAN